MRVLRRIQGEHSQAVRRRTGVEATPTLLIGAGEAGVMVAKELASRPRHQDHPRPLRDRRR